MGVKPVFGFINVTRQNSVLSIIPVDVEIKVHNVFTLDIHSVALMWRMVSAPYIKFRKYFKMRKCQKIRFKSFNMEVYEIIFFSWSFSFSSGQGKVLILQHFWLYFIISIIKEIWPMLRLSHISFYLKS